MTATAAWQMFKAFAPMIVVAILAAAIWGAWSYVSWLHRDRDGWRASADRWQASSAAWKGRAGAADALRSKEAGRAVLAVSEAAKVCDGRVAAARRSATARAVIIQKEPRHDPKGCPVRELLDPDLVRDAIGAPR